MLYSVGNPICYARGSFYGSHKKTIIKDKDVKESFINQQTIKIFKNEEEAEAYARSLSVGGNLSSPKDRLKFAGVFSIELKKNARFQGENKMEVKYTTHETFTPQEMVKTISYQETSIENVNTVFKATFPGGLIPDFEFAKEKNDCTIA